MMISFDKVAFEDFQSWASEDKKVFKKIGALIKDILRSPFQGIGKPEPLKHALSGYWSRRITDEHRLIYNVDKQSLYIISCKYHY
jgi:toxin YoeB